MPNWGLTDKRIYQLLKHPYQIDKSVVEEMTSAYLEFVEELFSYINKESDIKELIRNLNTSFIDFGTLKNLEESVPTEHSKLKLIFLDKIISLIDRETELIYRQMEYPKLFINLDTEWKSPFYLNPKVVNSTDVMEVVAGFYNIEDAVYRIDRKEVFFSEFAHTFGRIFNVEFGDVYKKENSVIKRKANKITEFLDRLKASVNKKSKEEGYQ